MELHYNFILLLLIFLRMSGCILFNPIFGRNTVPALVRVAISMVLTVFAYPLIPSQNPEINSATVLVICGMKELLIGFIVGLVIQFFLSVIIMGGEIMDMQTGLAMAKIYDPSSNVTMPVSALLLNAMFLLLFFVTNSHLTLVRIFVELCSVLPYGNQLIPAVTFQSVANLLPLMLIYAVKMSLPVVAVQFITEVGVGLITRAVPQMDVFSVQIYFKLFLGLGSMLILVPAYASFLERLIQLMFDNISSICHLLT